MFLYSSSSSSSSSCCSMRSMAVTFSSSPYFLVQSCIKPVNRTLMFKQSQVPFKTTPTIKIRSSFKTKVFEDKFEGIICYRDENGEMVCEGYDEGPRFAHQIPRTTYDPRDAEIMNILLQRWLEIVNSGESNSADKGGVAVQEDTNWNGFNTFY